MGKQSKAERRRQKRQRKKLQRRNQRVQKRQQGQPAATNTRSPDQSLLADLAPLFTNLDEDALLDSTPAQDIMWQMLDNEDLLDEPEFDAIMVPPMEAVETYVEVATQLGLTPETESQFDEEELEDLKLEATQETAARLLTDELRGELIDALDNLRQRWKRQGKRKQVPRVAAAQLLLEGNETADESGELVINMGFILRLVERSVGAGFALLDISMQAFGGEDDDARPSLRELSRQMDQPELVESMSKLIKDNPFLADYLDKQSTQMQELGYKALFTGELYLDLFSEAELKEAVACAPTISEWLLASVEDEEPPEPPSLATSFSALSDYLNQLFTKERRAQLRARMEAVLDEPTYADSEWTPFLVSAYADLQDDAGWQYNQRFLLVALLSEIVRYLGAQLEEEDTEADNKDDA